MFNPGDQVVSFILDGVWDVIGWDSSRSAFLVVQRSPSLDAACWVEPCTLTLYKPTLAEQALDDAFNR